MENAELVVQNDNKKISTIWVPIGPSGCGKSTLFAKMKVSNPSLHVYSWDLLRLEWYSSDYAEAFRLSCADKHFNGRSQTEFRNVLKTSVDIYLDNTNSKPKGRKWFLNQAKNFGYNTVAITFDVDLTTILARQFTRGDKNVPADVVERQFNAMTPPQPDEFDSVVRADQL